MIIGNGNAFGEMLMKSKGACPHCGAELTFGTAAQLARSKDINDNVVMCGKCHRVFEIILVPGKMTLTNEVTANYPQIKPKSNGSGLFSKLFKKG